VEADDDQEERLRRNRHFEGAAGHSTALHVASVETHRTSPSTGCWRRTGELGVAVCAAVGTVR